MGIKSLTRKRYEAIAATIAKLQEKITTLENKTPEMMWIEDLDNFEKEYPKFLKNRHDE
jgi:hypothetical protein